MAPIKGWPASSNEQLRQSISDADLRDSFIQQTSIFPCYFILVQSAFSLFPFHFSFCIAQH